MAKKERKKKKKAEETLKERVSKTMERGLDALFSTPVAEPPEDTPTNGEQQAPEAVAEAFEAEARAAAAAEEQAAPVKTTSRSKASEEGAVDDIEAIAAALPEEGSLRPEAVPETPPESVRDVAVSTTGDVTPVRLRPGGTLLEHPMEVDVTPPGPPPAEGPSLSEPVAAAAAAPKEVVQKYLSPAKQQELHTEIERLFNEVPRVLPNHSRLIDEAFQTLHTARTILLTAPERFPEAEYRINQVRALVTRYRQAEEWGRIYGSRILVYELVWLVALLGSFIALQLGQTRLVAWITGLIGPGADTTFTSVTVPFLTALIWGGIGGIVGALYSLWWHVAQLQDFDKRYTMWYLIQPIMGIVLGGLVFLIIGTGFLVLQGTVPTAESARGIQMFPPLVAALGGFRQKFVYELLERIVRVLTPTSAG